MLSSPAPLPQVIVGARSDPRAHQLARWLQLDERLTVIGIHASSDALFNALDRHPAPCCLLLDDQLSDLSALELIYRLSLSRTLPIVVINSSASGDFIVEALRAGACECLPWPSHESDAATLAIAVERAWARRAPPTSLRPLRSAQAANSAHEPTHTLVALLGSDAIDGLCAALSYPLSTLQGALFAVDLIHPMLRTAFVRHLNHYSLMCSDEALKEGVLYKGVHLLSSNEAHALLRGQTSAQASDLAPAIRSYQSRANLWLSSVAHAQSEGLLEQILLVVYGQLDVATTQATRQLLHHGAAIAEHTDQGYRFRHQEGQAPLILSEEAFWATLLQPSAEVAASSPQTALQVPSPLEAWDPSAR